jgi:hypothetical protein
VIRAMQQEPDRRYQNTAEMKHEVQTIRLSHDPNARAPQPRRPGEPAQRSGKGLLVGGIAALLIAGGATAWFLRDKNGQEGPGANNPKSQLAATSDNPKKPEPTPEPATKPNSTEVAVAPPAAPPVSTPPAVAPTPATPPPSVAVQPPVTTPPGPSTSLTPPATQPSAIPTQPPSPVRPVINPEMANAVVQLSPNPPNPDAAVVPTIIVEPWKEFVKQGDGLARERDPDGAVVAYERAIDLAESADPPVSPVDIARVHQKIGNIAALRGSPAEARGSYENARRSLQRVKGKPADVTQLMTEIDTSLRRLPRE